MDTREVLCRLQNGEISVDEAEKYFKKEPFMDLGFAKLDTHRKVRSGFPETVFCKGKDNRYLMEIFKNLYASEGRVMGTLATFEQYRLIFEQFPEAEFKKDARIIILLNDEEKRKQEDEKRRNTGYVAVCSAGTADIPVAEEAAVTAEFLGCTVKRIYDIGVSGIHRLFYNIDDIQGANTIITVAGMEGALATVIGGLVDKPVITVPTSVGYGASFNGLSALLTMLNSCANGVATVNIDNGYGAGYLAAQINRMLKHNK